MTTMKIVELLDRQKELQREARGLDAAFKAAAGLNDTCNNNTKEIVAVGVYTHNRELRIKVDKFILATAISSMIDRVKPELDEVNIKVNLIESSLQS